MTVCALTTVDNPFDPIDNYDSWLLFDEEKGYFSNSLLARIAKTSEQLSDSENDEEIENAIDEIIKYDPTNMFKKVKREVPG